MLSILLSRNGYRTVSAFSGTEGLLIHNEEVDLILMLPGRSVEEITGDLKATPHKDRLTALYVICLQIFRHLAQKRLEIRQYSCVVSIQSGEKSDCASAAQSLCGVALKRSVVFRSLL